MLPDRHSLEEIWNSDQMRDIRRAMVEGEEVPGCKECYENERTGGTSMRTRDNQTWEQGWLNEAGTSIAALKQEAVDHDHKLPFLPVSLEIDTGSLCNLKCRMCHGAVSSRIAKDPVHGTWSLDAFSSEYHDETLAPNQPRFIRFPTKSFIVDVDSYVDQVKRMYFIGGEPTLVREIRDVLERIVQSGRASEMELALVSNGTITGSWLDQAEHFKGLQLAVSVDGFGPNYEYIRYPYRWPKLAEHIETLRAMPKISIGGAVTLQAYNALNIVDLFRYFDSKSIGFYCYPIYNPRHLSIWAMPATVRRVASERLQAYAETECLPQHRDMVLGLAHQTAPGNEPVDDKLIRQFMLFTNDLDLSRSQSIHEVDPELVRLLDQAGYPWIDDTLYARKTA